MPYHLATAHHLRTPVTIQSERIALPLMKKEKKRREMTGCVFEDTQKKADFHYKPNQFEDSKNLLALYKKFLLRIYPILVFRTKLFAMNSEAVLVRLIYENCK